MTGGASGLGQACAARLAEDGVEALTVDIAPGADFHVDGSDAGTVAELHRHTGGVDILINSAGIIGPSAALFEVDVAA